MEYTISKVAKLSGVTNRTLRYYDEIGLLKPNRINSSGYRIYSQKEINKLHQILLYRSLDVDLDSIKKIITNPNFNEVDALKKHKSNLENKKRYIDSLIKNVEKTLFSKEGEKKMSNKEKFKEFKENLIKENEEKYGEEVQELYSEDSIEKSNAQFMNMSEDDYDELVNTEKEMFENLKIALENNLDKTSEVAQRVAQLHKKWITYSWGKYNEESHKGVVSMYVDDERFKKYYDDKFPGAAELLRDSVIYMIDEK